MQKTKSYPGLHFTIIIFFMIMLTANTTAQGELNKVNVYTQFGAVPGLEATLNVELPFYSGDKVTWYGRGGVGFGGILLATGGPGASASVTMLTGKTSNHFELNGGLFIGYDNYYDDPFYLPILDLGYRYQKPKGGFIFKVKAGILGVGIGLGYAF